MKFGSDLWVILRIIIAVAKALLEFFGDDEDIAEMRKNGFVK